MAIRVVILEDHQIFRIGLKYVLDRSSDIQVIGEAEDLASARRVLEGVAPDVVVLDLDLPDASGLSLLEAVSSLAPAAAVLVVSGCAGEDWANKALASGARGYVDKAAEFEEVIAAVRAVHAGRRIISTSHQGQILRRDAPTAAAPDEAGLSTREQEVLCRIARGLTNQQVADELFLSVKTIETYRSRLTRKLGISARSDLFEYARTSGLLAT